MTTLAIPCWIVCGRTAWSESALEDDEITWIVRAFERQEDAEAFFAAHDSNPLSRPKETL
jgi:hypothetical protein